MASSSKPLKNDEKAWEELGQLLMIAKWATQASLMLASRMMSLQDSNRLYKAERDLNDFRSHAEDILYKTLPLANQIPFYGSELESKCKKLSLAEILQSPYPYQEHE